MAHQPDDDLARWLGEATRGLTPDVRDSVQAELEAHYHDAVRDHVAAGKSETDAHRAALADLGDAAPTARALRETHSSPRRYEIAMILSLIYPFAAFGFPALVRSLTGSAVSETIAYNLAAAALTFYVLLALRRLVVEQTGVSLDRQISLLMWGIGAEAVSTIATVLIFGPLRGLPYLWGGSSLALVVLDWVTVAGFFTTGLGLMSIGRALLRLDGGLWGLRHALAYPALADGLLGLLLALGIVVAGPNPGAAYEGTLVALSVVAYGLHTIIFALLTLLFFRVLYRQRPDPLQVA